MTLDQQIEEAILSTLVVENKESIKRFCVPKIKAIVEKYGSEMLHEYPPVYHHSQPTVTSEELGYLSNLTANLKNNDTPRTEDIH